MEQANHRQFREPDDNAIAHGGGGRNTERLAGQARFSEEIGRRINPDHGFFALSRDDGQLDLAGLHIKHGVGRIALGEDHLAADIAGGSSTFASLGEKSHWFKLQTWLRFHTALARQNLTHQAVPTKSTMSSLVQWGGGR